jgi:hypothetical protein
LTDSGQNFTEERGERFRLWCDYAIASQAIARRFFYFFFRARQFRVFSALRFFASSGLMTPPHLAAAAFRAFSALVAGSNAPAPRTRAWGFSKSVMP